MHTLLDLHGNIPTFISITDGKFQHKGAPLCDILYFLARVTKTTVPVFFRPSSSETATWRDLARHAGLVPVGHFLFPLQVVTEPPATVGANQFRQR